MKRQLVNWQRAIPPVLALLLVVSGTHAVSAQEVESSDATPSPTTDTPVPTFAIYPKETGPLTFFDVTQEAGTTASCPVLLGNLGGADHGDFKGRTFAVDVGVKINGGLDTGGPDGEKTGPATWLEYPNDLVTLEPGMGIERTFAVTVPDDTLPGEYVTAICFETAEPIEIPGTPNLQQNLRQTIAFYVTVPGETHPAFSIENVRIRSDPNWSGVEAEIVNTGNVTVQPEGRITIDNMDGSPVLTQPLSFGDFYAGHTGTIQVGLGELLPMGDYLVTIELRDIVTGVNAILEDQPVTAMTSSELEAAAAPPVEFIAAAGEVRPSVEEPQFLNVDATLLNNDEPVADAELSLEVRRDGELVENYVVVSPLSLPPGETNVSSRYVPLDGWEAGSWEFTLSVQVQDRQTGVSQILTSVSLGDPIVIP